MGFQIYDKVLIRIPTQSSQPCFEAFLWLSWFYEENVDGFLSILDVGLMEIEMLDSLIKMQGI